VATNPLNRKLDKKGNPIVSKKELDESGLSLRDFLNRERGLTRRKSATEKDEAAARDAEYPKMTSAESAAALDRFEKPSSRLNSLENKDWTPEVVPGMKKGGAVSSASKRADGIAQRGKTRGTMVMCGGGYMKGKK
jgi:hypothetical protein